MKDIMPFDTDELERSLQSIPREIGCTPRAVLVVSGHWEAPEFTVQTSPEPPMLYDYGGFPDFTYRIQYPAPGSPEVAGRVAELLDAAGIAVREDPQRGFDHGTFAPLFVLYPDAQVPVVQLSLRAGYDPAAHLAAGRALAPLRDEGVLIVGSGLSYHNLRLFNTTGATASREFDDWLYTALTASVDDRRAALEQWDQAPSARLAHPTEEHLLPLMVTVGAAGDDPATRNYHDTNFAGGLTTSGYRFASLVALADAGRPGADWWSE
jgi:aromatic ring-opening dioxygenase catalytic subunit (LigB family)